jgi:hypothetical protein
MPVVPVCIGETSRLFAHLGCVPAGGAGRALPAGPCGIAELSYAAGGPGRLTLVSDRSTESDGSGDASGCTVNVIGDYYVLARDCKRTLNGSHYRASRILRRVEFHTS